MPTPRTPLPAHLGTHFSTAAAIDCGVSRSRLRGRDLVAPFHGVRQTTEELDKHEEAANGDSAPLSRSRELAKRTLATALCFLEVKLPGAFICGLSAAAIYQYPADEPGDLDVGVFAPRRAPRGKGVRGRKVAPELAFVHTKHGLPITTPASTWAMLGRELSERKLIILADAILQIPRDRYGRQHPEQAGATLEQLCAAIDAGRRVGLPRLRSALSRARIGSSSPLETEYRLDAEDAGLPDPELDVEIHDARGRRLGISEIVYPGYRLVVEIEGDHHRTSRRQWNRDLQKYRDYAEAGWEVVRITSRDIRTTRQAPRIVRQALLRRGWTP